MITLQEMAVLIANFFSYFNTTKQKAITGKWPIILKTMDPNHCSAGDHNSIPENLYR